MTVSRFIRISVGVFFFFFVFVGSDSSFEVHAENAPQYKEVVLSVEGIGCITCEWNIERKLENMGGVKEADVDSKRITWWNLFSEKEGKALITYDADTVTIQQLIETIEKSSDAVYTYTASVLSK